MEKIPKFIKNFSKEEPPEERQQVAEAIKSKRQEHFSEIKDNEEKNILKKI